MAKKKQVPHNKGKKASIETRKKMSDAQMGNTKALGHKHSKKSRKKMSDSHKGKKLSAETRKKMSDAHKGRVPHNKGKKSSIETRKKLSDAHKNPSKEARQNMSAAHKKISDAQKGIPRSLEVCQHMSAGAQGVPYEEWESFACEKKYCPKFNEACRESCRAKYDHRCFMCGKKQADNKTKTGKVRKLSVHHVDMDRAQGCDSNWKLVPLCLHHHATAHNDEMIARLGYILRR